ncbi:MAG: type IV toxin-antitoxin system AbiEi family antitoxin domain-containing protein, partial [Cellulomonas sp.]|nr:type IV toxin-antitoxin system AbiEi family antitoxin domain-containing protein [Cellulomonas sp.]
MDVCARLSLVSARTQGLATAAMLRDAGASRSALARAVAAGRLVRPLPRLYSHEALPERPRWVVTDLGVDPTFVARVRAVLMSHGPSYAASGRTAA